MTSKRTRPHYPFPSTAPTVHHLSQTSHDLDSEVASADLATYSVHMPPTPDNQPLDVSMERSTSMRLEDQYASGSLFIGGYNCLTRARLKEKVIDSESNHPQMTGVKGSSCAIPGCDAKVMIDERGLDIVPCECDFKICRDCYRDVVRTGDGICPGCRESYKESDVSEYVMKNQHPLSPSSSVGMSKMERRFSLMKSRSMKSNALVRGPSNEFDHAQFLFETKGSYGYGNAFWPKDGANENDDGTAGDPKVIFDKAWKPLTRKVNISAAILSPYRYKPLSLFSFHVNVLFQIYSQLTFQFILKFFLHLSQFLPYNSCLNKI